MVTLTVVGAFFTVATLAFDPIESLLDAMLNFDGDEVPLLCTVEMLSVEADITRAPLSSSIRIRWISPSRPEVD